MEAPLDLLLARSEHVKRAGTGFTARCPCHDDRENSLSISEGDDGRVLLKCFAGCSTESIVETIGLTMRDLFVERDKEQSPKGRLNVARLAEDKAVPVDFLRSLGLMDRPDGVLIPYFELNGSPARRNRLRTSAVAKDGSIWLFGKGKPVPYGLNRLRDARDAGYVVFVEGESDAWTLWFHGFPALGIPGASMTGKLQLEHLDGIERIVVIREPGQSGDTFVDGMSRRLAQLGWSGDARVVQLGDAKDPNELHQRDPDTFKTVFQAALDRALTLRVESPKVKPRGDGDIEGLLVSSGVAALDGDSSATSLERALGKLAHGLGDADPIRRASTREAAVNHLKNMGLSSPAKLVDAAIGVAGSNDSRSDLSGKDVILSDPEPWPDEVEGSVLATEIADTLSRFVALPAGAAMAIALWILHCYTIEAVFVSPILAIVSPLKQCGKTTLLELIGAMVPRLLLASSITSAALFRSVEKFQPTLLVDEADTFLANHEELRGVLNAGHTRNTARVVRVVGDKHEPRVFSTWCPKAIALIGRLPETLEDRSIVISMRRRAPHERVERLRRDRLHQQLEPLRRRAARWAADHLDSIRHADPEVPAKLSDRAQDNWRPLLAIGDAIGDEWTERARETVLELYGTAPEAENAAGVQLLDDIQFLFVDREVDRLSSEEIVEALIKMEDRPWPEWRKGNALTKRQLARLLKPFDVRPRTVRTTGGTPRGYHLEDFRDAFSRYLRSSTDSAQLVETDPELAPCPDTPSRSATTATSAESQANSPPDDPQQTPLCFGSENTKKGCDSANVADVAVPQGGTGQEDSPDEEFEL